MATIDVANEPLAQVRAKLIEARDQNLPLEEQSDVESRTPVIEDSSDDGEIEANDGAVVEGNEAEEVEDAGESGAASPGTPPKSELEVERERFRTVSANNKTLSDQNRELQKQYREAQERLAAIEKTQADAARQAEVQQKQQEIQLVKDWIRNNVPQHLQEATWQEYTAKTLIGEANEFGKHVLEQQQAVAEAQRELQLARVRAELPKHTGSIVQRIADIAEIDTDYLSEVTQQAPFAELLATYQGPRDLAIIGEVLHAVGLAEKRRHGQRLANNRQEAVASGASTKVTTIATAAGGGKTNAQRIQNLTSKDFSKFKEELRKSGNPSAALNRIGA